MNSCLVLEGGGLRGAFTSGVLECLLEQGIDFDRLVGVSAGACVGASFASKQRGRNRRVNVELPSDKRYMGLRHLVTTGSYFNMKFVFEEIPQRLVPFDERAFFEHSGEFDVVTTSLKTGRSVVFTKPEMARLGVDNVLIASSSIPLLARPVALGGEWYYDGGVADSIPVAYALQRHEKAVVVLTRPRGYRKTPLQNQFIYRFAFRKHPEFLQVLLQRSEAYNRTLDFCEQMERQGRLLLVTPSPEWMIKRMEPSLEKRVNLYNHGYNHMQENLDRLTSFLL